MKPSTAIISALLIGLSIIFASLLLGNTLSKTENKPAVTKTNPSTISEVMTKKQLADYLQISEEAIDKILRDDEVQKTKLSGYDTYRFMPYVVLNDEQRFLKANIDEWLMYNSVNQYFIE